MNGNNYNQKPLRVSNSNLVGTLELKGCGERTDMTFPVVFYGPGTGRRYILPTMCKTPSVPTAGIHSFHAGYTPRTNLRVLMPVKQPEGIVLADISAEAYAEPDTVGELVQGVTNYYSPNGKLGSEVNDLKRNIYHGFDDTQVLLNTNPALQSYFADSLLAGTNYGLVRTMLGGSRARATPVDTLDLTVERTYELMKQIADEENAIRREDPDYKSHGLFLVVGNGDLEKNLATGLSNNYFYGMDANIKGNNARIHIKNLEEVDGAIIVNKEGDFVMSGAWITPHYHIMHKLYRRLGMDISDEGVCDLSQIKSYMGFSGKKVGTKHMAAHAVTMCAPDTVAFVLSGESGILSCIKNGRVVRQHPPNFELSYQPEEPTLEETATGLTQEFV